jgi:hypothetical protein
MQKARLVKASKIEAANAEQPQPRVSRTGQLKRAVAGWVSEHRASKQETARQAFEALFANA